MNIQQIGGTARSVSELLSNTRYGLDFYQREYKWTDAHVSEFIDDLTDRFLNEYDPSNERHHVASYRPYFLGPIVTAHHDGLRYVVDGQQRLTTVTLLLICLQRWLTATHCDDANSLTQLIYSTSYGTKSFNLNVPERDDCLSALLDGRDMDVGSESMSVRNIWERYRTVVERFPNDARGEDNQVLPYFCDYLLHRVTLVEISVPDQDMALEIFESMNDRGLRLTNIDMLKSFLIPKVGDDQIVELLNERWRGQAMKLADLKQDADSDFIKAWLRGHHANTIRQRKARTAPGDFDIIGTAFHKWVRDKKQELGLYCAEDYRRFVKRDFFQLSERYIELIKATSTTIDGLEAVRHTAATGLTLQPAVILAAITPEDDDDTFREKATVIAGALDIFVVRRIVNYRFFGYSTIVYTMFNLMKELRKQSIESVRSALSRWLESEDQRLEGIRRLRLHGRNYGPIRYILARITSWLDEKLGTGVAFDDYMKQYRQPSFQIEHIWANRYDRYMHEFDSINEFGEHRNRIGGLLLLPKDRNAALGDMAYEGKVEHYLTQNPLAQSLHPKMYERNPTFVRLRETHDLAFKPYTSFARSDMKERQELLLDIAKVIWNPRRYGLEASV